MNSKALEPRILALEARVADLESHRDDRRAPRDWKTTVGMFTGDDVVRKMFELALDFRERDRAKAHRRAKPRKKAV